MAQGDQLFSRNERDAVYRAIFERRDMRHFTSEPVDEAVLKRLLKAAHHAPSVGYMQPWRFIRIQRPELRGAIARLVDEERERTAEALGTRGQDFLQLKVEGIRECAEVWVVTLTDAREQHIFGRRTLPEMDLASTSCAIQNLWLAARAEGIGVGWVSLFDPEALRMLLKAPPQATPIAVLCIGHVERFYTRPMLEEVAWAERAPLDEILMTNEWQPSDP